MGGENVAIDRRVARGEVRAVRAGETVQQAASDRIQVQEFLIDLISHRTQGSADEVAVECFLAGAIAFTGIPALLDAAVQAHRPIGHPTLDEILEADRQARAFVHSTIERHA